MSRWKPTQLPAPHRDILTDRGSSTIRGQHLLVGIYTGATETHCRVAPSVSNSRFTFLTSNNRSSTRQRRSWIPQDCGPNVNHVGIVPLSTSTVDGCSLDTGTWKSSKDCLLTVFISKTPASSLQFSKTSRLILQALQCHPMNYISACFVKPTIHV